MNFWEEHGWKTEELEKDFYASECMKKHKQAMDLFYGDGVDRDVEKAFELYRENAINGFVPSMNVMTILCHDDTEGFETGDRRQELFWHRKKSEYLAPDRIRSHAFNLMEGSYDMHFPEEDVNHAFELAAVLGDEYSKKILARHFARKKDEVSLKKSLFWFYSIEKLPPDLKRELARVEEELGLKK